MAFDVRTFATLVRPSPKRSSPEALSDSAFDAGSPQYVRPEDMFLDIQARLFGLTRKAAQDLGGLDPADFAGRWKKFGHTGAQLQNVDNIPRHELAEAVASLLRCPQRKKERHPTLLPMFASLGFYKNIKPNLPNFLNDQLRPALQFADEVTFQSRISSLQAKLINTQTDDSVAAVAQALLPAPIGAPPIAAQTIDRHPYPMLRDYAVTPSRPLGVCRRFGGAIDVLLDLEPYLPRIIWVQWLTSVLRLWLPLFFLRRCAVTTAAAQAAISALKSVSVPTARDLTASLFMPRTILRGSAGWINQLAPLIQNYVRARFELSILLDLANLHERLAMQGIDASNAGHTDRARQELATYENALPPPTNTLAGVKLSMPGDVGPQKLELDAWLKQMVSNKNSLDGLATLIGASDACDLVEKVYAHVRPEYEPLNSGFTKNLREFVAYNLGAPLKRDRDPTFPDEFNLIYRGETGRRARQVSIQPGPRLLGLLVQLVSRDARVTYRATAKLGDLLDLFEDLGIDFRSNPDDFERLKADLLRLGLMQSSADAAEAAALKPIYSL